MTYSSRAAPSRKLGSLEVGRFIAASIVVVNHTAETMAHFAAAPSEQILGGNEPQGAIGVEYFFVLSGFVMLVAHRRDFGQLAAIPRFFWRRICRIYPAYWLALIIPFIILHLHWGGLRALGMLSLTSPQVADVVPPAWSLQYELAFYAVFGLALLPVIGRWLLAIWAALLIWLLLPVPLQRATAQGATPSLRHFLLHHSGLMVAPFDVFFVAGLLAALLFIKVPLRGAAGLALAGLGIVLLIAAAPSVAWYHHYPSGLGFGLFGVSFASLLLGVAVLERSGALRCGAGAFWLGDLSYPLYILHVPLLLVLESQCANWLRLPLWPLYLLFLASLAAVYLLSTLATLAFDQPLQRLLRGRR